MFNYICTFNFRTNWFKWLDFNLVIRLPYCQYCPYKLQQHSLQFINDQFYHLHSYNSYYCRSKLQLISIKKNQSPWDSPMKQTVDIFQLDSSFTIYYSNIATLTVVFECGVSSKFTDYDYDFILCFNSDFFGKINLPTYTIVRSKSNSRFQNIKNQIIELSILKFMIFENN